MASKPAPLLRKRVQADARPRKLGVTRLADARAPLGDVTNALTGAPTVAADYACAPRLPPCMAVPPPPSPARVTRHVPLVGDAEIFFEAATQPHAARASTGSAKASTLAAPWNLSGVLATLQSRASSLLTEEGPLFDTAPHASAATAALGSGLDAMGRVAAVVGTAIDSFVEGGLDSLQSLGIKDGIPQHALTPEGPMPRGSAARGSSGAHSCWDAEWASLGAATVAPAAACTPARAPSSPRWGWADTPFSAPRPAHSGAAAATSGRATSIAPLRATRLGPDGTPAPRSSCGATPSPSARVSAATPAAQREAEDLAEQVRAQLQLLLAEKARLAADNARLARENKNLQELLSYTMGADEEDCEEGAPQAAACDTPHPMPAAGDDVDDVRAAADAAADEDCVAA